jgi:hypothetical protein
MRPRIEIGHATTKNSSNLFTFRQRLYLFNVLFSRLLHSLTMAKAVLSRQQLMEDVWDSIPASGLERDQFFQSLGMKPSEAEVICAAIEANLCAGEEEANHIQV